MGRAKELLMRKALRSVVVWLSVFVFVGSAVAASGGWDEHLAKLQQKVPKGRPGLFGHDGVQWAGQDKLKPSAAEMAAIVKGFADPQSLFAKGVTVEGVKYMATRADATIIIGKKATKGVVFAKGVKTIVGLAFDEADGVRPADALVAVQSFVDYLKGMGF